MELGVKVEVRLTDTRDDASATQSGKASKASQGEMIAVVQIIFGLKRETSCARAKGGHR
jgi:hypothetical protein